MPPYGERFHEGEVVLIHFNDKPTLYARVEHLQPDHKKGWWRVALLLLTIPPQSITWILDEDQVRGADFTMQGHPVRLERVKASGPAEKSSPETGRAGKGSATKQSDNIISLFEDEE